MVVIGSIFDILNILIIASFFRHRFSGQHSFSGGGEVHGDGGGDGGGYLSGEDRDVGGVLIGGGGGGDNVVLGDGGGYLAEVEVHGEDERGELGGGGADPDQGGDGLGGGVGLGGNEKIFLVYKEEEE